MTTACTREQAQYKHVFPNNHLKDQAKLVVSWKARVQYCTASTPASCEPTIVMAEKYTDAKLPKLCTDPQDRATQDARHMTGKLPLKLPWPHLFLHRCPCQPLDGMARLATRNYTWESWQHLSTYSTPDFTELHMHAKLRFAGDGQHRAWRILVALQHFSTDETFKDCMLCSVFFAPHASWLVPTTPSPHYVCIQQESEAQCMAQPVRVAECTEQPSATVSTFLSAVIDSAEWQTVSQAALHNEWCTHTCTHTRTQKYLDSRQPPAIMALVHYLCG